MSSACFPAGSSFVLGLERERPLDPAFDPYDSGFYFVYYPLGKGDESPTTLEPARHHIRGACRGRFHFHGLAPPGLTRNHPGLMPQALYSRFRTFKYGSGVSYFLHCPIPDSDLNRSLPGEGNRMDPLRTAFQVIIALGIYNVWLIRPRMPTRWRGGEAENLSGEFEIYGLPPWAMGLVGFLKILFATLLMVGIWYPPIVEPAAMGMAIMMAGAVSVHLKVGDPLRRAFPACILLVLSLILVFG